MKRPRYQFGTLYTEPRKSGPDVWVYRWRETNQQGSRQLRKQILGTVPSTSPIRRPTEISEQPVPLDEKPGDWVFASDRAFGSVRRRFGRTVCGPRCCSRLLAGSVSVNGSAGIHSGVPTARCWLRPATM